MNIGFTFLLKQTYVSTVIFILIMVCRVFMILLCLNILGLMNGMIIVEVVRLAVSMVSVMCISFMLHLCLLL